MIESEHDVTVKRINELARKAKAEGLTEEEMDERNALRKKYIDSFKSSLRSQLDNIKFVDEDEKK
ncbi:MULTISPECIES: DUF896 domain-containing protein [Paenibacillus]|uniref:UPF0291 protein SAMN04487970_101911 n=2 Tax=Paenibacillus TaxID=44249 RepID=A0A1G4RVA3_9BACL|nr:MULTISPECIES: DUF896 domain-containing protein [Paenibacillus]MCP1308408.1 DUF896 domain-containing protein [Paenibacillus tyrfis]MCP3775656.1 DUF896 domain-containing protein [Paenibacillus sp. MZ04-78.2]MDO3680056.1 DUF896 domain-containing protein [Paenibacillus ehimensis]MEC0212082.1 DUF896 domain-containing protein [Paenibacillus ehimensis]SCW60019.1 protein of unknown function [Paenibacillus tianmuensis]